MGEKKLCACVLLRLNDSKIFFPLHRFLIAAQKYGVSKVDLFPANDLWELKNISVVTQCIFAIGRAVSIFLLKFGLIEGFLERT